MFSHIFDLQDSQYSQAVTGKWLTARLTWDLKDPVLSLDLLTSTLHKAKPYCEAKSILYNMVRQQLTTAFTID